MWIQFLLIAAIVVLAAFVMRRTGADSHLAIRRLLLGLFVLAAVLSVLFPQWLSWVANLVGVGRGTDLLLYALVVVFLAFVYSQYRRNVAQQRQVTLLARRIALLEARLAESATPGPEPDEVNRTP
jgi:small membrane protein